MTTRSLFTNWKSICPASNQWSHAIPTPVNAALQRIANRLARDHVPPGSLRPEEVLAEIET